MLTCSLGGAYIHECLKNTAFEGPALSSCCNAFFNRMLHLHSQALSSLPESVSRTCVGLFSRSIKGQLFEGTVNEAWTREGVHIHGVLGPSLGSMELGEEDKGSEPQVGVGVFFLSC